MRNLNPITGKLSFFITLRRGFLVCGLPGFEFFAFFKNELDCWTGKWVLGMEIGDVNLNNFDDIKWDFGKD